jgi:hypothetical protein
VGITPRYYGAAVTPLAQFMEWVFIAAWCVGAASHIYASCYFLPMWASGFKKKPEHQGYGRKVLIGYGIFIGAILVGFLVGGIAKLAGGWA